MLVIVVLAIGLVAVVAAIAACHFKRERTSPVDLEGEWWAEFETQFRAYAARQAAHHRRLGH
jgi:hypothetical protein